MHGTKYKRRLFSKTRLDKTSHSIPRLSYLSNISNKHSILYSIPMVCGSALLLLGLISINPIVSIISNENAYAEEVKETGTAISLSIDGLTGGEDGGTLTSNINANSGDTAYISHNVTINVTNADSYSLQISAASNGTSTLQHDSSELTIPGANGTTGNTMIDNTWGYSWGETGDSVESLRYYTLPSYGNTGSSISEGLLEAASTNGNNVELTKKLSFGAKFADVPSGHYTTTALLSLAASPKEQVKAWSDYGITTMQEMNYERCSGESNIIPEGTTGRLKDTRDGKYYWVTKLKDGLCWMTQNLDYDGGGTSSTSFDYDDIANNTAKYYDPGEYISTQPTEPIACSNLTTSTGLVPCTTQWELFNKALLTSAVINQNAGEKLHYSVGNYYNWLAATNNTGLSSVESGEASGSICPSGWKLPTNSDTGSYTTLFTSYGNKNGIQYGDQDVRLAPLYFTYGGYIIDSNLKNAGEYGEYWSSTVYNSLYAYCLEVLRKNIFPADQTYRYTAISIRCVAR